jgi:carboxypeptidase family protein
MFNLLLVLILTAVFGSWARPPQEEKPATGARSDTQQPAGVPERKVSAGSIKGRVIGEGGRAVPNATISAFPVNLVSNPQAVMTSFLRPVTSDTEGNFQLTGLQPGAYTVSASALGYVLSDTSSQVFHRPGDTVTLTLVKGGVITGKVTNSSGDPIVGAVVRSIKIREPDNKPVRTRSNPMSQFTDSGGFLLASLGPFKTDDRGIYRIYGLDAGYYQVAAGGRSAQGVNMVSGAYDADAPTYHPSSTIDTAAEVLVRAGDEAANIDIRYRDYRGHSLSGSVLGSKGSGQESITVFLSRASNGISEATTYVLPTAKEKGFAFDAVLDGEYFVTAMLGSGLMGEGTEGMNLSVSPQRRVTISGSDVTGIELALEPLASIAGRTMIEPAGVAQKAECKTIRSARPEEIVISTRSEGANKPEDQSVIILAMFKDTTPNEKGEFTAAFLRAGVQRLIVQLPGEQHYLKSITLPGSPPNGKLVDVAKSGVKLKSGDKVKGLVVTIGQGAAGFQGKVVTGKEGKPPPEKMRAHLIPAEPEAGDQVLRYFESDITDDGAFRFTSLAPGNYWLVARVVSDQELAEVNRRPVAWDEGGRTSLRFEGEASKETIALSPCERLADYVLSYTPLSKPSNPGKNSRPN